MESRRGGVVKTVRFAFRSGVWVGLALTLVLSSAVAAPRVGPVPPALPSDVPTEIFPVEKTTVEER